MAIPKPRPVLCGLLMGVLASDVGAQSAPPSPPASPPTSTLRVAMKHMLPLRGGLSFALGALGEVLHMAVRSDDKGRAAHVAIDPKRGVLTQQPIPQLDTVIAGAACQGLFVIAATRPGSPRFYASAISSTNEVVWQHELPVRGTVDRAPGIVCAPERAMAFWAERDKNTFTLAILALDKAKPGAVRRIAWTDHSDDLLLVAGPQRLAALRTSSSQQRLEGLLLDATQEVARRVLRTDHSFAPFLIPVEDGWLMSYTRADSQGTHVELQPLAADLTNVGTSVLVAREKGRDQVNGDGLWKSPTGRVIVAWRKTAIGDRFVAVEHRHNGPTRYEPAHDITRLIARYTPQTRTLDTPLQLAEFGFYEGCFVGESLLLVTPSALNPAVLVLEPRGAR